MTWIDLMGRRALVTGGGNRVGAAIARALGRAGCHVAVHYATSEGGAGEVAQFVRDQGRHSMTVRADLSDRAEIRRLASEVTNWASGSLDLLVNNAANFERVTPEALSEEAWDRAMDLNATAPYLLTLAVREALCKASGSMIAVACTSAERPWKNYVPYSVSKAALAHLVRGLALALAPDVRVNAVAPGAVLLPVGYDESTRDRLRTKIPVQRLGEADDVARAVVFLAQNDYVTGHVLTVDGGRSLI